MYCILRYMSQGCCRDLINDENPADGSTSSPCQLLLPELRYDTARALLHFLYTDKLPSMAQQTPALLYALSRAAAAYRIPRLLILTDALIATLGRSEQGLLEDADGPDEGYDAPPCTLTRDLGSMVGDPSFADVRFVAEGRVVYAHRFVLQSRSGYFRAMFRSGMREAEEVGGAAQVAVPDTFVGLLRLLIYMYTATLPEGADGQLLEDLMAADRLIGYHTYAGRAVY